MKNSNFFFFFSPDFVLTRLGFAPPDGLKKCCAVIQMTLVRNHIVLFISSPLAHLHEKRIFGLFVPSGPICRCRLVPPPEVVILLLRRGRQGRNDGDVTERGLRHFQVREQMDRARTGLQLSHLQEAKGWGENVRNRYETSSKLAL